jgi:hypothetical protein
MTNRQADYRSAEKVIEAIDDMAKSLTGDGRFFI